MWYAHSQDTPAKRLGRSEAGTGQQEVLCSVSPSIAGLAHGRSDCWDTDEGKT